LGWQDRAILAAGRTDTGVHAAGQVIAFDLEWGHELQALRSALNAALPVDVSVRTVQPAKDEFHPRYDARARRYTYQVYCQEVRHPLLERYAWRVWPAVRLERLLALAGYLPGTHDFSAYGTPPRAGSSTIRSVAAASWRMEGDMLVFEITANAFLYHMVRRLVFSQVAAARLEGPPLDLLGEPAREFQDMLRGLAPPHGLVLTEVIY
jgi:tRNA pseudouridine38-40 synthase